MKKIPMYAADLIAELDRSYPSRCPRRTDAERDIWIGVGERLVVDRLLLRQEHLNKKDKGAA